MPTPTKGPRLGGGPAHERLILANLATALFEHGHITTTQAKAKRLRPLAERLITFAKRGDLHARRRVLTVVRDRGVVHTLFADIGPRFAERPGGYTRITKLGPRKGDNAPMAVIALVEGRTVAQQAVGEAERARGSRFRRDIRPTGRSAPATAPVPTATVPTAPVPTEGEADGAAGAAGTGAPTGSPDISDRPQVPVPTEGGDTEVVTEPVDSASVIGGDQPMADPAREAGDQPAEGTTSTQTADAAGTEPAEGDRA